MFEKLKTIFKGKEPTRSSKTEPRQGGPRAPINTEEKPKAERPRPTETKAPARTAAPKKPETPEELCSITPKMGKDEIRARLALLYKRYNRATSSLDAGLRAEAEEMLDAIVVVREKVFGAI